MHIPTRQLRSQPDLDQLKRQAKELLAAFLGSDAAAVAEVNAHFRDADPTAFALHEAQLVLARAYGFASWPKLKAYVDGVNIQSLLDAVRAGDLPAVQSILQRRPELAGRGVDNFNPLHFAVLCRSPELVRLLMRGGANAREGVYPHRESTTPLALAQERGDQEIVAIIEDEERRRREAKTGLTAAPAPDELISAIGANNTERAQELISAQPELLLNCDAEGATPLHRAAQKLNQPLVLWLLARGASPTALDNAGRTPLDVAARQWYDEGTTVKFPAVAAVLLDAGAPMTARAAAALGDTEWLIDCHAQGELTNPIEDDGGLLRIAVSHDRPAVLALLLDFGFDPDERLRFDDTDEASYSWGMPLWHCAGNGKYALAELLLVRGADPNGRVMASGDPVFQAYSCLDWEMVALLERHGGVPNATTAGLYRQTDLARRMISGEAPYRLDGVGGDSLHEQLLWGGACGGDPEIVRLALEGVTWPPDDPCWFTALEQPLRIWGHGPGSAAWERATYLECFQLVLERCDPNLRGRPQDNAQFGLTMLHSIAGSREHVRPEERVAFATMLLDAGADLSLRDNLLCSTPLGWACRYGRAELVRLFLERGADAEETEAQEWARPEAWAQRRRDTEILKLLSRKI